MPQVSIILPNYNHSGFLDRRFRSIFNQTFKDFELIILDDCSLDSSREVIEQYRHEPRVSCIIYNEVNSGSTFKQWDKGISLAKGAYIWIAESDDFCEPTFLEELVPAFQQNDRDAVAFCQTLYVSTENRITYKTHTDYLTEVIDGRKFLQTKMLGTNTIGNASMTMFRKSMVDDHMGDYKKMKYCGDWLFWVNLCFKGDVYISGKYLNYYLRHDNNVASNATRQGYDFIEGNQIYHIIKEKVNIRDADKETALKQRVVEYLRKKDKFQDQNIHKQVIALMHELDPRIDAIMRKMIRKEKVLNFMAALNKMLP